MKAIVNVQAPEEGHSHPWTRIGAYFDTILGCRLAVLFFAAKVILILPSHFWLDETNTLWSTSGGLAHLRVRAGVFFLSIPYTALILGIRSLGVKAEWIFRLPSVLAVGLATFVLFRIARHLWGRVAAWLSIAMFVSLPGVSFAARNARPYGIGLLLVVVSTWLLLQFIDKPSVTSGLGYGATAALATQFHLFFVSALVAQALYFCYRVWRGQRVPAKYIVATLALMFFVIAPLLPSVHALIKNPGPHSFASPHGPEEILVDLFPPPVLLCLLACLSFAVFAASEISLQSRSSEVVLSAMMALIPILVVAAASHFSKASWWVVRYYLSYAVGLGLCFGFFAGAIRPTRPARLMAFSLTAINLFILVYTPARQTVGVGDWAPGAAYVERDTAKDQAPVLVVSQYPESNWEPVNPVDGNPMFSQFYWYPSKARFIGMPELFGPKQARYIDELLEGPLHGVPRILVWGEYGASLDSLCWYIAAKRGSGARFHELADFDGLKVIEFTRDSN